MLKENKMDGDAGKEERINVKEEWLKEKWIESSENRDMENKSVIKNTYAWSFIKTMQAVIRYVVECPPHRLQLVNGTHFMVCTKCGRRYDVVNDEWRGQWSFRICFIVVGW